LDTFKQSFLSKQLQLWTNTIVAVPQEFSFGKKFLAEVGSCMRSDGMHRESLVRFANVLHDGCFQCPTLAVLRTMPENLSSSCCVYTGVEQAKRRVERRDSRLEEFHFGIEQSTTPGELFNVAD
jgi:hypothetical protein